MPSEMVTRGGALLLAAFLVPACARNIGTWEAGQGPAAICPDDMTVPTRSLVSLGGDAESVGAISGWRWEVVSHNTDTDPQLGSPNAQDTSFWALRPGDFDLRLTVTDGEGSTDSCQFRVTTTPTGPTAICPPDIQTTPLTPVTLVGDGEDDGVIVSYRWRIVSGPTGSTALWLPDTQTTGFEPDVVGEYLVELEVIDNDGGSDTCTVSIVAISGGLRVEMYWNPPEDLNDFSDVDLHLLHPLAPSWFDGQWDCHFANCDTSTGAVLDWDLLDVLEDNPRLDLDDVDGFGPENINIDEPVAGRAYTVGVHYLDDVQARAAEVYIKIYCGVSDQPTLEIGPQPLEVDDFWKVAEVDWLGNDCTVSPIGTIVPVDQVLDSR